MKVLKLDFRKYLEIINENKLYLEKKSIFTITIIFSGLMKYNK